MAKRRKSKQKLSLADCEPQMGFREIVIDEMYVTNFGMDEKRRPQEYVR
jgi:hypothetical protein